MVQSPSQTYSCSGVGKILKTYANCATAMISAQRQPTTLRIFGKMKRPTNLPYTALKPEIPWQRRYKKRQRHHPKDFKHEFVSRVPWSELNDCFGTETIVSFRKIGAEMRGWEHELEATEP